MEIATLWVSFFTMLSARTMTRHNATSDADIQAKIKNRIIVFAGNRKLKIYGRLNCSSGKRMKRENRLFFSSETEAMAKISDLADIA